MNTLSTDPITTAMRAVVIPGWGDADQLQTRELPVPEPGLGEVRVAVHAAGLNPVDLWSRRSGGFSHWGDPPILGWDLSGVIDAVGTGVSVHRPGDPVYGLAHFPRPAGTNAEYTLAPARQLAPKPPSLSHLQAAALPLAGLIAWQALIETARLQAGQRVLIHAGGGGVGHLAIQIAKAHGAEVITTARADKRALVRDLGADVTIDPDHDWTNTANHADVVLDPIGGTVAARSLRVLRDGGTLLSIAGPWEPSDDVKAAASARRIRTGSTLVEPDRHGLIELTRLVEAGKLRPVIAATYQLDDLTSAHRRGEQGHLAGKIVTKSADRSAEVSGERGRSSLLSPTHPIYGASRPGTPGRLNSTSVSETVATLSVRVFLSYTHDSEMHRDRVLALADQLRGQGLDAIVDRYVTGTPVEGWPAWMEDQVRRADFVLVICTETYHRRYSRSERPGIGLGARWESNLVRDELYGNPERLRKYIPVLAPEAVVDNIPEPLRYAATRYHLTSDYDALYRHLTGQPEVRIPPLGSRRIMPGRQKQIEESDSDRFSEPIQARFAEIGRTIAALTEEQHRVIRELHGQRRALICGCAGSGKTLVAAEKAMRLSHAGLTTLFVCHNPRLADWVSALTEGSAVKVTAFEDLIAHLAGGHPLREEWTNYSQPTTKTLEDARAALIRNPPNLDAIVVDEGQDFEPAWWEVLEAAQRDGHTGILYIFFDDQQALLPYRSDYPVASSAHDLSRNCRNAGQVYDIMRRLVSGSPPPDEALATHGEAIFVHRGPGQLESALIECLEWLREKDALDDSVAVLGGRVSFEHSILARRSFVLGSRFDWREAIAGEVDRIVTSPDGSVAFAGGYRTIKRALKSLGDDPIPSRTDVELVRHAAARLTTAPVPTPKDVRWGEPDARPTDSAPRAVARLMTARGPRLLRQAEVVSSLRTGSWANAVPKPSLVTFAPHASASQGAIPVYGVGEIKGLEREVVLVVMQGDAPELLHELYVGVSRARVLLAAAIDERVFAALPTSLKDLAQRPDETALDTSSPGDAGARKRPARPGPPSRSVLARKTKRRR